jgi:hypothetical protein
MQESDRVPWRRGDTGLLAMLNLTFGIICAVVVAVLAYFVLRIFYDAATSDIMQSSLVLALLVGLA